MPDKLKEEFDRQINNFITKGYPDIIGISEAEFTKKIKPLASKLNEVKNSTIDLEKGFLPFVIVINHEKLSPEEIISLVEREGKQGIEKMYPHKPSEFTTIDSVQIPNGFAYLLTDIDRGKETLNITPNEALEIMNNKNRAPLTINEGITILIHYPDFLKKNNCFSLLASRISTNKRVPAIWINSKKEPHLGWCWAGNPHTWLGSASCAKRIEI